MSSLINSTNKMEYIIFTQDDSLGRINSNRHDFDELDEEFLLEKKLIIEKNNSYYSNFVGEVITPHNKYFSLPKNQTDENLIEPIKKLLRKYKNNFKHKSLVSNNKFILTDSDGFKSTRYYFEKLSKFFLDFVTYEFIYPFETKKIHSISPIPGTIDLVSTKINSKIYGSGATYNVVDKKSENWKLDDIYFTTIVRLSKEVGSDSEQKEIKRMCDYLIEEGYEISEIDISNPINIIQEIKRCNVNIIHNPIKNILIDYFEAKKSLKSSNYEINLFYTRNFEIVWENILREILSHNPLDFGNDFQSKFKKVFTYVDYVPKSKESEFLKNPRLKEYKRVENKPDYIEYKSYDAEPDIFSSYETNIITNLKDNKFRFIGDAKYYDDGSNRDLQFKFSKEFSDYNSIQENFYPMVIFIASDRTQIKQGGYIYDESSERELIVIHLSILDVIRDYIENKKKIIDRVHQLVIKRTKRMNNQLQKKTNLLNEKY